MGQQIYFQDIELMSHGVIGNTSVFGTEESRFEPWWDNIFIFKTLINVPWCNRQHVGFWYRRVQVRALVGQQIYFQDIELMSHGVIGNTSVFGTEESRFEPWWDNIFIFKTLINVPWCNRQHVGFWYRRVQVRALVGQQKGFVL